MWTQGLPWHMRGGHGSVQKQSMPCLHTLAHTAPGGSVWCLLLTFMASPRSRHPSLLRHRSVEQVHVMAFTILFASGILSYMWF